MLTVAAIDLAVSNGLTIKDPGGFYLVLTLCVTYWSGLRAGLITIAGILLYLSLTPYIPGSAFQHTSWHDRHVDGLLIVLTFCSTLLGLIQNRIRNAEIHRFDAQTAAKEESDQRRFAEAALKTSEDMWRLVVSASMDAIVATDSEGRISLWNDHAQAMFGWPREEILGRALTDTIVPPEYREAHSAGLQRFVETGVSRTAGRRLELIGQRKDGSQFPIELTVVSHPTDSGLILIGFVRDITEYKKLNDRLRQAQRMEAIGTLAGGIAHEFNNILTAIAGNTALAKDDAPANSRVRESLDEIEKAVQRATHVVGQILSFGRHQEPTASRVEVEPTLRDAVKLLRAAIPTIIEIESRFEANLPPVMAEPNDFHQIILNLGINAAHAMRDGGGRFDVQAVRLSLDEETAGRLLRIKPGSYVRVTVGDTGCGMDSQTLQRIFDPFFTTKAVGEGTGLGLSVVYGIVERLGGAITVYSEPNRGTVFHLYFPVAVEAEAAPEPPARPTFTGRAERILYVDDDEALVFMMERMLKRLNYDVTGFEHPGEALKAIHANPDRFDVLITDISMPHLDGPDFVRQVRAIRPDLPVVMVTGYIRPEDTEKANALGINHLILKPNTVHEMSEVLTNILGGQPAMQ